VLSARAGRAETDLDFGLVDQLLRAAGGAARPELPADEADSAASSFAVGAHLLEFLGVGPAGVAGPGVGPAGVAGPGVGTPASTG
jgi:hypothetical protein